MLYPIIVEGSQDGGGGCTNYPEVNAFSDLPTSTASGNVYLVLTDTYVAFPPKLSGFYKDEASGWVRKAPYSAFFLDTKAVWYDEGDSTKRLNFQLSAITTGNTRTITMADANVDLADIALNNTHRSSDGTDHTYINQDVTSTAAPSFGGIDVDGGAIFNDSGADVDFRVESDISTHAIFMQGSDSRVGISTSAPNANLSVSGSTVLNKNNGNSDTYLKGDTVTVLFVDASNDNVRIGGETAISANFDLALIGDGVLCLKETSTPTADTNYGKVYCKNDNKLYFQDGAGTEHEIAFV